MSQVSDPFYINSFGYAVPSTPLSVVNPDLSKDTSGVIITEQTTPHKKYHIWTIIFVSLLIFMYLSIVYVAGYHAYTEYADDPPHIKWMRILVALIFAPLYVGYVLIKSFVIDFLKSNANSFDFSFMDYVANIFVHKK